MRNGDYILVKAPEEFPGKKYRGRYCYEHHLVYWQHYGVVPNSQEIIHHIDENKYNNDISNLELKTRSQHSIEHNSVRKRTMVRLKCPGCGKIFVRERRQSYLVTGHNMSCCSHYCVGVFTGLPKMVQKQRLEEMFIEEFKQ